MVRLSLEPSLTHIEEFNIGFYKLPHAYLQYSSLVLLIFASILIPTSSANVAL